VNILFVGPLALTLISWSCSWMIGTARTAVQRFGWMLSAAILAPASAAYAAATGQWPYVAANLVFAVIAVRGYLGIRNALERSTSNTAAAPVLRCNGCTAAPEECPAAADRQRAGAA
jgi:hypothetical protein